MTDMGNEEKMRMTLGWTGRNSTRASLVGLLSAVALVLPGAAGAQTLQLDDFLTGILRDGIVLAPPASGTNHEAHFIGQDSPQFRALAQVNQEMSWQLSNYPLSSSAGGFAYVLDPDMGVLTRPTRSFGPIYGERPLTVGQGRFNLGVNVTEFSFDELDDLELRGGDMRLVFTHADTDLDGNNIANYVEGDVITADLSIDLHSRVTSFVGSYGLTDRVDLGVLVPLLEVEIDARVDATVQRLATGEATDIHRFANGTSRNTSQQSASASGIGDIALRGKARLLDRGALMLAANGDLRLPTGDDDQLLGTGRVTAKLALIGSWNDPTISPHAALGFTKSSGASNRDEWNYGLGVDWAVDPKLTLAGDILGRVALESRDVSVDPATFTYNIEPDRNRPAIIRQTRLPRLGVDSESGTRHSADLALGFKVNVAGNFLVTANGLYPMASVGLRDEFSGLVGLDYSF